MEPTRRATRVVLIALALQFVFVPSAHAYLDVGTASVIFQGFVAAVLGGFLGIKVFWRTKTGRLTRLFSSRGMDDGVEP